MNTDPTIDRIRATRHEISEEFEHDPEKLVKYYMKYQKKYKNLITSTRSNEYSVSSKKPENITT